MRHGLRFGVAGGVGSVWQAWRTLECTYGGGVGRLGILEPVRLIHHHVTPWDASQVAEVLSKDLI